MWVGFRKVVLQTFAQVPFRGGCLWKMVMDFFFWESLNKMNRLSVSSVDQSQESVARYTGPLSQGVIKTSRFTVLLWSRQTDTYPQIGGKWALDLHFTLLLIPFSMLILPFLLGCFKYASLRYGHLNTTSQSWKEKEVWSLLLHFLAIWALEHHFPKVEGDRSMAASITLPGNLGTRTPLPKGERRKKYAPF